jgi:hypothetical protein
MHWKVEAIIINYLRESNRGKDLRRPICLRQFACRAQLPRPAQKIAAAASAPMPEKHRAFIA